MRTRANIHTTVTAANGSGSTLDDTRARLLADLGVETDAARDAPP